MDIARHRLFKHVKKDHIDKRSFHKRTFANKGFDITNLVNILHQKSVKSKVPPYFKDHTVPIISYGYATHIGTKNVFAGSQHRRMQV